MANELKNFTELDYSKIKESFKDFLKDQEQFKDYNFDGSAINVFLGILAYHTQYNAFYGNMTASEKFLPLAQRRQSVVDLAQNLGYTPRSARSAQAIISFQLFPEGGHTGDLVVPADTLFTTKVDDKSYTFRTTENVAISEDDGEYNVSELDIYEGKKFTHSYVVENNQRKFLIPNKGVDTTRLTVVVKDSEASVSGTEYEMELDFTQVEGGSQIYFLEETDGELFQIVFGDGITGMALKNGNVVEITYYKCAGSAANNATSFSLAGDIDNVDSISEITVDSVSFGGAEIEDIDSIRVRAPAFYQRQNRVVTAQDYVDVVKDVFPNVKSVTAWGGEDNVPPRFGSVFVSIVPDGGFILSESTKESIAEEIKNKYAVMGLTPVVVNPDYLYVIPTTTVTYDSNQINPGVESIRTLVKNKIIAFNNTNLTGFARTLRYSKLSTDIDTAHSSILSNFTNIQIYIEPKSIDAMVQNQGIFFFTPITKGSLTTNVFSYAGFSEFVLEDDDGILNGYRFDTNGQKILTLDTIGTVDDSTGAVSIDFNKFIVDDINSDPDNPLRFFANPTKADIVPVRNQVLSIRTEDIDISVRDIVTGSVL